MPDRLGRRTAEEEREFQRKLAQADRDRKQQERDDKEYHAKQNTARNCGHAN